METTQAISSKDPGFSYVSGDISEPTWYDYVRVGLLESPRLSFSRVILYVRSVFYSKKRIALIKSIAKDLEAAFAKEPCDCNCSGYITMCCRVNGIVERLKKVI